MKIAQICLITVNSKDLKKSEKRAFNSPSGRRFFNCSMLMVESAILDEIMNYIIYANQVYTTNYRR